MKLKVGTRGSKLAIAQTQWIINEVKSKHKDIEIEIVTIKTTGDKIQNKALNKIGDKGLFVKEIEQALLEKRIDVAIHSMKDLPSVIPEGLTLTKSPLREDPRDVLITKHNIKKIYELPNGAIIGTGSIRRRSQLLKIVDCQVVGIRGNIDTRIKKMIDNELDGIILAYAGIKRLGIQSNEQYSIIPFDIDEMLPAPCQGIIALEVRDKDYEIIKLLESISDIKTSIIAKVERDFLKAMGGNCHIPIGAYTKIDEDMLYLKGLFGTEDGNTLIYKSIQLPQVQHDIIGFALAKEIKEALLNER